MRTRLAAIVAFGVFTVSVLLAFKFAGLATDDRSEFILENVQNEAALAKTTTAIIVDQYADRLTQLIAYTVGLQKSASDSKNEEFLKSDFVMISLLSLQEGEKKWESDWIEKKPGMTSGWKSGEDTGLLEGLPLARVEEDTVVWFRQLTSDGQPIFALIIQLTMNSLEKEQPTTALAVGFLTSQSLSATIESFKGTDREAMVIDERGYALAYTSQKYVGAKMDAHPVVENLLSNRQVASAGRFKNLSGASVVAGIERLNKTNLYVVVARQVDSLPQLIPAIFMSLGGFAIGALLLSLAFGVVAFRPALAAYDYLQDMAISLAQGLPLRQPEPYADLPPVVLESIHKLQTQGPTPSQVSHKESPKVQDSEIHMASTPDEQKKEIYKEIASGLTQVLKNPINAILGQAQLARSKSHDESLKENYTVIEREARRARETIEHLGKISGGDEVKTQRIDLQDVALAAISQLRPEIERVGAKVHKELKPTGQIMGEAGRLKTAVAEILKNSLEALVDVDQKEIFVASKDEGDHVVLMIQDTGVGIQQRDLDRIFDPFYTTKSDNEQKGLGLSVARGIVQSFDGKVSVQSASGQGAKFLLRFPLTIKSREPSQTSSAQAASVTSEGVQPIEASGLWATAPTISSENLAGHEPLTGSEAENLPIPPAADEITFVGEVEIPAFAKSSETVDEAQSTDLVDPDIALLEEDDDESVEEPESSSPVKIEIRKPKVRTSD